MTTQNQTYDVIIIGGGIAGFAAALGANEHRAKVLVLEAGAGASTLAGGAWDVATPLDDSVHNILHPTKTIRENLQCFVEEHPHHPYAKFGDQIFDSVEAAHQKVLGALGGYRELDLDEHGILIATEAGTLRRVATAQQEIADIESLPQGKIGVLDLPATETYLATRIASSLSSSLGTSNSEKRFVPIDKPQLASELEIRSILAPPQNFSDTDENEQNPIPQAEVLASLANIQGLRLKMRIDKAIEERGNLIRYGKVKTLQIQKQQIQVELEDGEKITSQSVVFATGKHIGGGIQFKNGRVTEPLLNLPIWSDSNLIKLPSHNYGYDPTVFYGSHFAHHGEGFRVGVGVDAQFRVLKEKGSPISSRLFAAGALLAGFDPALDGTGFGCCTTTGFFAGKNAASIATS